MFRTTTDLLESVLAVKIDIATVQILGYFLDAANRTDWMIGVLPNHAEAIQSIASSIGQIGRCR